MSVRQFNSGSSCYVLRYERWFTIACIAAGHIVLAGTGTSLAAAEADPAQPAVADTLQPSGETLQPAAAAVVEPATVPPVLLTPGHAKLSRVNVGEPMPAIELARLDGEASRLADLCGQKATVVAFWQKDRWMSHMMLQDIRQIAEGYGDSDTVKFVGIAVRMDAPQARDAMAAARADFPTLLDPAGQAFAKVGTDRLPRVYLLNAEGHIVWFDIEHSSTSRRELRRALAAILNVD